MFTATIAVATAVGGLCTMKVTSQSRVVQGRVIYTALVSIVRYGVLRQLRPLPWRLAVVRASTGFASVGIVAVMTAAPVGISAVVVIVFYL